MLCCKNLNTISRYLSKDSLSKNLTCILNDDFYRIAPIYVFNNISEQKLKALLHFTNVSHYVLKFL